MPGFPVDVPQVNEGEAQVAGDTDQVKVGVRLRTTVEAEVVADVDVVVVGGGTAGAVAAVAAARNGARVLLVERRGYLGGMMTGGNVGLTKYVHHEDEAERHHELIDQLAREPSAAQIVGGIPLEITERLVRKKAALGTHGTGGSYVFTGAEEFKLELLDLMEEAGVELLLHSLLVDVVKVGDRVRGVVVENKAGRQVLGTRVCVDATGDGDLAARAGVPFVIGVAEGDLGARQGIPLGSLQGMGVMFRVGNMDMARCLEFLRAHPQYFAEQSIGKMNMDQVQAAYERREAAVFYVKGLAGSQPGRTAENRTIQFYNTPLPGVFTCCCPVALGNGLVPADLTRAELTMARLVHAWVQEMREHLPGCEDAYLLDCPEIGVRETRHVRGEYVLDIHDVLRGREFEDSIGRGSHAIDISPLPQELADVDLGSGWSFTIPYRSLVAASVDNVLLAGRCVSCTHEASGCVRPSVQCMVTGEGAGTAAAMCAAAGVLPRSLDPGKLRRRLEEQSVVL